MFLQLPLPVDNQRTIEVYHFRNSDTARPMKYGVKVGKHDNVGDLMKAIASITETKSQDHVILADITAHRIFSFLPLIRPVSQIRGEDITFSYVLFSAHSSLLFVADSYPYSSEQVRTTRRLFFDTHFMSS
jgi:hypothetical protein